MARRSDSEDLPNLFALEAFANQAPKPKPTLPTPPPKRFKDSEIESLERTVVMLKVMIDMGVGKDLSAALLGMGTILSPDQLRYLSGPVSVHIAGGWEKDVEGMVWLHQAIAKDRLDIVLSEIKSGTSDGKASESEVMACMYSATMVAPMTHDWADVYTYANSIVIPKHKFPDGFPINPATGEPYKDWWEMMGFNYPFGYERVKFNYDRLARDIRCKVVEAARMRGVGAVQKTPKTPTAEEQYDLFNLAEVQS